MIIYPAIDLINGQVVRLTQGDYEQKTSYSDDPVKVAKNFAKSGAEWLHVIDLDGAKAKRPVNLKVIGDIAKASNLKIQIGGGLRTASNIKLALDIADRAIVSSLFFEEPETVARLIKLYGTDRVAVSLDYKDGRPAYNGWLNIEENTDEVKMIKETGVGVIIVTDTKLDGMLQGPNIGLVKSWLGKGLEVICAGGVSSIDDIVTLRSIGVDGAILGKAMYENKLGLREALNASL